MMNGQADHTTMIDGFTDPDLRVWRQDDFQHFIDSATGEIGRVVSSEKEPAGAHVFYFWAADDALTLDVGHIVVAFSEEAAVIGVVDEPRRYSDLRSFMDDYFDRHVEIALADDAPTQRPEILVYSVRVLATRHRRPDVQSQRPVINGPVYFATQAAIRYALGTEGFSGERIPALMHTNGNYLRDDEDTVQVDSNGRPRFQRTPLFLDEDYLLGPEAGHANWTGQSGLATKTSHALFLVSSIFQTLSKQKTSVAALMFNVKGPDLLWLDKPAQPGDEQVAQYAEHGAHGLREEDISAYAAFGLEPAPFDNARIFAPFKLGQDPAPNSVGMVDLAHFSQHDKLNTARTATGETDNVFPILWSLGSALYHPGRIFDFNDLDDKMMGFLFELREEKIQSLDDLNQLFSRIEAFFGNPENEREDTWKGHHKATIRKARNRFNGLRDKLGGLLANGVVDYGTAPQFDGRFVANEVRVVDISSCNTTAQELIVSSAVENIWKLAEKSDMGVDKLIIFVDELNKYAPAGGESGLRNTLVDIAARGRHLNVVLLGAQQFRSKVDGEILGNCGTSFYGRIGDEEIINPAYRSISETARQELLGLPKGRMLVRHAHYRAPLFGTFPMPPTIQGAMGQRIFAGASRVWDPAEGLHSTLRKLMGTRGPSLAEIRAESVGIGADALENIRSQVEKLYANKKAGFGQNPWEQARKQLRTASAQVNRA